MLPVAISLAGLPPGLGHPWSGGPRAAVEWAAGLGAKAVALDAAVLRGRDLDRSARRDIASMLRRVQLDLAGVDLWIPPEHYADPATADRAVSAVADAANLAAELARLVGSGSSPRVSIILPSEGSDSAARALAARADRAGAAIADHAWPTRVGADHGDALGVGIDPAAVLAGGSDPAAAAGTAKPLVAARLSDLAAHGRVPVGAPGGRLDVLAYVVALTTAGFTRHLIADCRGVTRPADAARAALDANPLP